MITSIEIENFRCFDYTKIEGFSRVNLIGGKNNSGKTALLEAILLNQSPQVKTILLLRQLRKESNEFSKAYPEKTWDNLFFTGKIDIGSEINSTNVNNDKILIALYVDSGLHTYQERYSFLSFGKYIQGDIIQINSLQNGNTNDNFYSSLEIKTFIVSKESESIKTKNLLLKQTHKYQKKRDKDSQGILIGFSYLISTNQGFQVKDIQNNETIIMKSLSESKAYQSIYQPQNVQIISSSYRLTNKILAEEFDKACFQGISNKLISVLQIIDSDIKEATTFSIGEPQIYLKRKNENYLPISLFGDAINKIAEIILKLINNDIKIMLIDEIENGIHYTNHRDFWKALFELSKQLNVQIFATTHSLEMIQAFADVGLNYYPQDGVYFEMTRHYETEQIIGIKRDLDTLDYALKHGKGVRGE